MWQITSAQVPETIGELAIQLRLSSVTDEVVSVPFTVSGTATENVDYQFSSKSFIIPAGSTSGTVTVHLLNDHIQEPDETIVLALGTPMNAILEGGTTTTITIRDSTDLQPMYLPLILP